jgi:hypothetical protein
MAVAGAVQAYETVELAAVPQAVVSVSSPGEILTVASLSPSWDFKSFAGHPLRQSLHTGAPGARSLALQIPSPQEPQTPFKHLMPSLPQLASDTHSTHPFSVLLQ